MPLNDPRFTKLLSNLRSIYLPGECAAPPVAEEVAELLAILDMAQIKVIYERSYAEDDDSLISPHFWASRRQARRAAERK